MIEFISGMLIGLSLGIVGFYIIFGNGIEHNRMLIKEMQIEINHKNDLINKLQENIKSKQHKINILESRIFNE